MREVELIDDLEAASALLHPLRLALLRRMSEPRTCTELGREVGETPQKIHYHVKVMERLGLVQLVQERRVRGVMEGLYRAAAHSYWLAPELVGRVGGERQASDRMSLGFLLEVSDRIRGDISRLARRVEAGETVDSLGVQARVRLRDGAERQAFKEDLETAVTELLRKYGRVAVDRSEPADEAPDDYEIVVACYPRAGDTAE